jgi:hypothetical protein
MENTKKDTVQNDNDKIRILMKEKELLDKKSEELAKMIRKLVYAR